jgi:hypothetical protein
MNHQPGLFRGHTLDFANGLDMGFLHDKHPSPPTCWRQLKQWDEPNLWLDAWRRIWVHWMGWGC